MAFWRFYVPVLPLLVMFGFASLDVIHNNVAGVRAEASYS